MARLNTQRRAGTIMPFLAVTIVAILSMVALGIDIGLMSVARTEAQDIADLSAMAGARQFNGDPNAASRTTTPWPSARRPPGRTPTGCSRSEQRRPRRRTDLVECLQGRL